MMNGLVKGKALLIMYIFHLSSLIATLHQTSDYRKGRSFSINTTKKTSHPSLHASRIMAKTTD